MTIVSQTIAFDQGGLRFEAQASWDDAIGGPRPLVLVAPSFMGRTPFEDDKAAQIAALGFVGFAVDIYGVDVKPANAEEASAAMAVLNEDRALLQERMFANLKIARELEQVDSAKAAAIGFCFGGKCVLDLARGGADVLGVAAFHGVYDAPPFANAQITAKVLMLHGWDDPLCPPDAVLALATELTDAKVDWQIHAYGHTVHAFTNPKRPEMYSPVVDARSWRLMQDFLAEIF
ncbi:dienelactone hydrolase family protein [Sphingomonas montanisoli]|uniref:Dienelactone hydrolase family protein n=1 Tax=Sphingomonas montanisoli TaxID=2606412 RepID=A0A5D9C3E8_9SPHN|nr:dienelactone hydrolase family protein [Sphingomonas montanisoli]TZG26264.1 dienelactone hydrolase family protein [Sphingomonas montanisoli]